jgi:hypothetical protein
VGKQRFHSLPNRQITQIVVETNRGEAELLLFAPNPNVGLWTGIVHKDDTWKEVHSRLTQLMSNRDHFNQLVAFYVRNDAQERGIFKVIETGSSFRNPDNVLAKLMAEKLEEQKDLAVAALEMMKGYIGETSSRPRIGRGCRTRDGTATGRTGRREGPAHGGGAMSPRLPNFCSYVRNGGSVPECVHVRLCTELRSGPIFGPSALRSSPKFGHKKSPRGNLSMGEAVLPYRTLRLRHEPGREPTEGLKAGTAGAIRNDAYGT